MLDNGRPQAWTSSRNPWSRRGSPTRVRRRCPPCWRPRGGRSGWRWPHSVSSYGDIGTSPLYALKQAIQVGGAPTPESILGILSLIFWALVVIVSAKYAILIMRADNHGEGGIVAMLALLDMRHPAAGARRCWSWAWSAPRCCMGTV